MSTTIKSIAEEVISSAADKATDSHGTEADMIAGLCLAYVLAAYEYGVDTRNVIGACRDVIATVYGK